MLRPLPDLPPGVIGFEAVGEVHSDDYRDVLRPALDEAAAQGKVHLVYVLGPEFTGYSTGASWQDLEMGMHHLTAFERTAVVTDVEWVEHLVRGFGWMVPGALRRFPLDQRDVAVRWAAGEDVDAPAAAPAEAAADEPASEPSPVAPVVPEPVVASGPEAEPQPQPESQPVASEPAAEPATSDAAATSAEAEAEPAGVDPAALPDSEPAASAEAAAPAEAAASTAETPAAVGGPQTMTPHAPMAPGADMRPGLAQPTPPQAPSVPAQWAPDPTGRHTHRWWDGTQWTGHVADNGVSSFDPIA